jgi:hypothetical protein
LVHEEEGKSEPTVISQTSNIILYLSARVGQVDLAAKDDEPKSKKTKSSPDTLADPETFHKQELLLTILDLNNEVRVRFEVVCPKVLTQDVMKVHENHHPIDTGDYYEGQKEAALKRTTAFKKGRVPKYFKSFESNLKKRGSGYFLAEPSYADLALFHMVDGVRSTLRWRPVYSLTARMDSSSLRTRTIWRRRCRNTHSLRTSTSE